MNKFKVLLLMMSFLVVIMCFYAVASITQNVTQVLVNSSENNNWVNYELNEMSNSLMIENITYSGTQSYLRYLTIPRYANITAAVLNITGFNNSHICYQETANISTDCGGLSSGNYSCSGNWGGVGTETCDKIFDGDWDTHGTSQVFGTSNLYINYSKPDGALNTSIWQVKDLGEIVNLTINQSCWDYSNNKLLFRVKDSGNDGIWYCYDNAWIVMREGENGIKEEAMWWNISVFPSNVSVNINNDADVEFNHSTRLDTDNQTDDFASEVNDYVKNHYTDDDTSDSYSCSGDYTGGCSLADDNDYDPTQGVWHLGANPLSVYETYDIRAVDANYTRELYDSVPLFGNPAYAELYCYNYTGDEWSLVINVTSVSPNPQNVSTNIPDECLTRDTLQLWNRLANNMGFIEGKIVWIGCIYNTNNNCQVPINITSTNGKIQIDAINITYDYNISHLYDRNNTYTWNQTEDVLVNTPLKRRYSIQPTSDLASNNITNISYYSDVSGATLCEINNTAYIPVGGYCPIGFNVSRGSSWPTHYVWDSNITQEYGVNQTNVSWQEGDIRYHNFTLTYRDSDNVSLASVGTFTNTTMEWYYNESIMQNHKLEYLDSGTWYDITPSATADCITTPVYTRKTAGSRVFHVCLDTTNKYVSLKVESSS